MLLTYKNKQLMFLDRLIETGRKQLYGIIEEVEMTPKELFELIREIESQPDRDERQQIKSRFSVEGEDNSANIFNFFKLDTDFVDNWKKRVYTVTYREVVLRLVDNIRKPL